MKQADEFDVLVVGAGPTGLMLANQLGRRNVRVLIIDRHPGPARETRALGVQARTLEIYASLGVVERALAQGKPGRGANIWASGRRMARIPIGEAGRGVTPYPYVLVLGQDANERILGDRLHDWGIEVRWNTELVALAQDADGATATLKGPDGTATTVRAGWVAGCDGAHSAVRTMTGVGFPGAPYEHVFFVADTEVTGSMVADEVNVYLWRSGFHLFFPMRGPDHWRLVGIVPAPLRDHRDLRFDDVVDSLKEEAGTGLAFKACTWFSTYRIHHRRAAQFRVGRCFLLGDAAHVHSPVGAQGMNTGLQDAYNLGWKLALVVQGRANAALLDSYAAERIPVARRLLETTDRAFRAIVSDGWAAGLLRTQVLARVVAFAMSIPAVQRIAFGVISQTAINYRDGPLSHGLDGCSGTPRAGDRFPWLTLRLTPGGPLQDLFESRDDTRFTLYVFGQAGPPQPDPGLGPLLHTVSVPSGDENARELACAGIPAQSFYLVRPDGHIGLCGGRLDTGAIAAYAADALRVRRGAR